MPLDLKKLEGIHNTLGRVITVCKSGTPSTEVAETLGKDLQDAQALLFGMTGGIPQPAKLDPIGVRAKADELQQLAKSISENTGDLNLLDQLERLGADVANLAKLVEAAPEVPTPQMPAISAEPAPAPKPVEGVPPPATQAAPQASQATSPAPPAVASQAVTSQEATPAVEPKVTGDAPAAAAAESGADAGIGEPPAPEIEVVTKSDLEAFGQQIVSGIAAGLQPMFEKFAVTLKSAAFPTASASPFGTLPAGQADPPTNGKKKDAEFNWGNIMDLNQDKD